MSATLFHASIPRLPGASRLRFGHEVASEDAPSGEWSAEWLLKRNCSIGPRQMLACFGALCVVSLGIGSMFWLQGAPLVMPFAGLELLAVAAALLLYARHATDREAIHLRSGSLVVEHASGRHVERVEFAPAWVRVEPEHGNRSLVELSGQGRRISVGRFVRPELRRQLAEELRWALRRWQAAVKAEPARTADAVGLPAGLPVPSALPPALEN